MKENWPYNFEDPWEPQDVADKQEPLRGFWLFNPQKRGKTFKGFYVSAILLTLRSLVTQICKAVRVMGRITRTLFHGNLFIACLEVR